MHVGQNQLSASECTDTTGLHQYPSFYGQGCYELLCAEGDPSAWPGPKAWPASLILVSFFSINICFQALLKALDPVVVDNVPAMNWLHFF